MALPLRVRDLDELFELYMVEFELCFLSAAVTQGKLGRREVLPVRPGKLTRSHFGAKMGTSFQSPVSFAIDYYGLLKRSTMLFAEIQWMQDELRGRQVKAMESVVIHFASVRIEDIARLTPELVGGFPTFKKTVLDARGFKNNF